MIVQPQRPVVLLPARWLEALSLVYLIVPNVIFYLGWVSFLYAFPLTLSATIGGWWAWRLPRNDEALLPEETTIRWWKGLVCLLVTAGALAIAGNGGFFFQVQEQIRHATILLDLTRWPWPTAFQEIYPGSGPQALTYNWGYYLLPSLIAAALGWAVGWYGMFLWTAGGMFLIIAWFLRITRAPWLLGSLLFLFFGGLDLASLFATLLTAQAFHGVVSPVPLEATPHFVAFGNLNYWPFFAAEALPPLQGEIIWYAGTMARMEFGVQHMVPAWIAVLMILHDTLVRNDNRRTGLLYAAMLVSSPLVALGTTPYALWAIFRNGFRRSITVGNLAVGVPMLTIQILYFSSSVGAPPHAALWAGVDIPTLLPYLLIQYLTAFGVYFMLAYPFLPPTYRDLRPLAWLTLAILLALPWYRVGYISDFSHNGIGVAQIALLIMLALVLWGEGRPPRWVRPVLATLLCVGAVASGGMAVRAATWGINSGLPDPAKLRTAVKLTPGALPYQVRTDTDALFWRHFARTPEYTPLPPRVVRKQWELHAGGDGGEQWAAPGPHELTPEGIRIPVDTSTVFLRYIGEPLPSLDAGAFEIRLRIHTNSEGPPPGGWPSMFVRWSDGPPLDEIIDDFFLSTLYVEPAYNRPWDEEAFEAILSRNSLWKGEVSEIGFEIRLREELRVPLELVVESITLYHN